MVSYEADVLNKNVIKIDFVSHRQIVQLFCGRGSLEGAIKTIDGRKKELRVLYMILYTVFSGKLAITTGCDMLINLHLFE